MNETPRAPAASIPPAQLVDRILLLSESLADVVTRETEYLRACKPLQIQELQEEKTRLANEYALDIQAISLRKELIDRAPAERIVGLKAGMAKLNKALATNRNALDAAKSVSERILKSVAAHVGEHKAPTLSYGRNAAISRSSAGAAPAIALDARI